MIGSLIRDNASLTSVSLKGNQLCGVNYKGEGTYDASGIKAIADALRVNASLTSLRLDENSLGPEGAKALAPALAANASLTEVRAPAPPPRCACMPAIVYACLRRVG